jgi:hypothetical protein
MEHSETCTWVSEVLKEAELKILMRLFWHKYLGIDMRSVIAVLRGATSSTSEDVYELAQQAVNDKNLREREIADLKKQLAEANKKLAEANEKNKKSHSWSWDFVDTSMFGGGPVFYNGTVESPKTAAGASLVKHSEPVTTGLTRLLAYFEKRSRENKKRAEDLEAESKVQAVRCDYMLSEKTMRRSYFHSGKSNAYSNAAVKVKEAMDGC